MLGSARTVVMLAVALVPGGLLVLATWIVGKVVFHRMHMLPGDTGHKLARAVSSVRWRDIWTEARSTVAAPTP